MTLPIPRAPPPPSPTPTGTVTTTPTHLRYGVGQGGCPSPLSLGPGRRRRRGQCCAGTDVQALHSPPPPRGVGHALSKSRARAMRAQSLGVVSLALGARRRGGVDDRAMDLKGQRSGGPISTATQRGRKGGAGRDALEGGKVPPSPPSRAPSLCAATVSLTPSAGFNGICNRQ